MELSPKMFQWLKEYHITSDTEIVDDTDPHAIKLDSVATSKDLRGLSNTGYSKMTYKNITNKYSRKKLM